MFHKFSFIVIPFFIMITISGCSLLPGGQARNPPDALSGATPTPIPTPIVPTKPVYEVKRGDVAKIVQFAGRVAPIVEEELFFGITGRVRRIYFKRDDLVTEGQVIADLEIDDVERELASGLLELERAEQQLAEAEAVHNDQLIRARLELQDKVAELTDEERNRLSNLDKARIELTMKQLRLAQMQAKNQNPERIKAEAALAQARIDVRRAQDAYDEIAFSDDVGKSSQAAQLERATLELEQAQAEYELAIQAIGDYDYDLAILNQEIALAELDIRRLQQTQNNSLKTEVALAQLEADILKRGVDPIFKNNVARSQLNVQKLEASILNGQLVAPFDGKLLSISLSEGREVAAFKPVAIVGNISDLEITADLRESQLLDIEEGMPAIIRLSSRPGEEFLGQIRRLPYPYGGGGRSQGVEDEDESTRIALEKSPVEFGLELGDLVRVEVEVERSDDVLWIPPQAIRTFDGRRFVVVQDGELQRRVDVTIGVQGEDRVEIEEGLTEGQVILGL